MTSLSYSPVTFTWNFASSTSASGVLHSSCHGVIGVPLKSIGRARFGTSRRAFMVSAKVRRRKRHVYPWDDADPNLESIGEILRAIHPFKPLKEKPKRIILQFERPLVNLQVMIHQYKKIENETGADLSEKILLLEDEYKKVMKDTYKNLTPIQRVYIARHPQRPTCLDHIFNITDNEFLELHGDRHGYDDPAIVTGLGRIDGETYVFIGQQKGRNTKESIHRNFGMPTPHGYRKALRMMHYADHHGFPIVTFIDTPGAFADLKSEELNQGEAIAQNLRTMFGLKVPIISIVIGEGGSGGALAISCANVLLMLENAVFYVASPEAVAAILFRSSKQAPKAARRLRITARELCNQGIADGIIREPLGGAHADPYEASRQIKLVLIKKMDELKKMDKEELLEHRRWKYRNIGKFREGIPIDPFKKRNMKTLATKEGFHLKKRNLDAKESSAKHMSNELSEAKKLSEKDEKDCKLELEVDVKSMDEKVDGDFFEESEDEGVDKEFEKRIEAPKKEFDDLLQAEIYDELYEEFEDVVDQSDVEKRLEALKKEIDDVGPGQINEDVLDQSEIDNKINALRKEIEDSGASSLEELSQDLKDRLLQLKEAVKSEVDGGGKPPGVYINHPLHIEKFREISRAINREKENVIINSPDLRDKIDRFMLEMKKAGQRPNKETRSRLRDMEMEIKQGIDDALESSEKYQKLRAQQGKPEVEIVGMHNNMKAVREIVVPKQQSSKIIEDELNSVGKYDKLRAEISKVDEPSGWLDGSLEEKNVNRDYSKDNEFKLEENLEANRSFD